MATVAVSARPSTLKDVLARLSDYLAAYEQTLVAVVAEERYEQAAHVGIVSKAVFGDLGRGDVRQLSPVPDQRAHPQRAATVKVSLDPVRT